MFYTVLAPYVLVLLGFAAGKLLRLRKEWFAPLLIYFLTPAVVFAAVLRAPLEFRYTFLPVLFFILCALICYVSFAIASRLFQSPTSNLLGFASADANTGYFGIPVGLALFGERALSPIVLCSFGFILYENTIGFYLTARGNHTAQESLKKVLCLPSVYAFVLALALNLNAVGLSEPWLSLFGNIRGAYVVLGMMMIGLAAAELDRFSVDLSFTAFALFFKFLVWPVIVLALLLLDSCSGHLFSPDLRQVIFFVSTMPLAANTVAIAALLETEPEKASIVVLLSTLLGLGVVPLLNSWFLLLGL